MTDATATYKFFNEIRPLKVSQDEFEEAAKRYFRAQFKEVGGVGAQIVKTKWLPEDDGSPFFVLCHELAEKVRDAFEFRPFAINLTGSEDGPEMAPLDFESGAFYGLLIEFQSCSIRVLFYAKTGNVEVSYTWPEAYHEVDEDGRGSGGSHRSKDYAFELAHPECVDAITNCLMALCYKSLAQAPT